VIFTSSDAGEKPTFPSWGAYGATKAAVNYVIKTLTLEEVAITAVGVYPGVVNTPLVRGIFRGECKSTYYAFLLVQQPRNQAHGITDKSGMSEQELKVYMDIVKPRLVEAHQPGSVIANLALSAPTDLRGEILFWDDQKFSEFL